jgi:hypothetical protein
MDSREYAERAIKAGVSPKEQWAFSKYLLDSEIELVNSFNNMVDGQVKLSNITDKPQLTLEKMQMYNLGNLLHLGIREPELLGLFIYCYNCWKAGLQLTRAVKGRERGLMALIGNSPMASAESDGFFSDPETTEEKNFFSKLMGAQKQNNGGAV